MIRHSCFMHGDFSGAECPKCVPEAPMTHPTLEERAKAIVNAVNADYADETFVSEGYGYFDDMTAAIAQALRETAEQARREAIEGCADALRAEEIREYLSNRDLYSSPPHRMDLVNHYYSDFIRSRIAQNQTKEIEKC